MLKIALPVISNISKIGTFPLSAGSFCALLPSFLRRREMLVKGRSIPLIGVHSLFQFVSFCYRQKLIDRVQASKIVTFPSVEKSLLPNIDIETPQQRAKW